MKITIDRIKILYAVIFSVFPVLLYFRFPFTNFALTTTLFPIILIILLFVLVKWNCFSVIKLKRIEILMFNIYMIYTLTRQGNIKEFLIYTFVILIINVSFGIDILDVDRMKNYIINIAFFASVVILIQTVVFYIFKFHIQIHRKFLLNDTMMQYEKLMQTGLYKGQYRPSGFFIEPSHFSQYAICAVVLILFCKGVIDKKKLFIITLGTIASTSGMGIVLVVGMFFMYVMIYNKKLRKYSIPILIVMSVVIVILYFVVPFFNYAVGRILSGEAITGRFHWWGRYMKELKGIELMFGLSRSALPSGRYFTGFMVNLYSYGIMGVVLLCIYLISVVIKSKKITCSVIFSCLYFGMLFVANQTSAVYILFYISLMISTLPKDSKDGELEWEKRLEL